MLVLGLLVSCSTTELRCLDPCSTDLNCTKNQFCKEIHGSGLCDCKKGFHFKDMQCVEADECTLEKDICGLNSFCSNSEGSYKCNCVAGYKSKTDDGKNCFDIDECKTAKRKDCGDVATCENTEGSFHCECPEGFSFNKKERDCYGVFEVDESHLAMNICPRHRDLFGVRWRSSKTNCTIPDEIASHKSKAKGLCGLRRKQSQFVYHRTQKLIPVGSKICKRCKEHLAGSLSIDASFQSFHDQPELVTPNVIEEPTPKSLTIKARKEVSSSSSDELTEGIRGIKITDESYLLSSDAGSEVSSTTDASGASSDDCARRQKLNVFLEECGIQPLGRAWLAWREISERTKERYLKQTSEIVSSVLRVISSENSPDLWKELQSSCIVNDMLGISQTTLPSEVAYLEALAEAYKLAKSWDTRRQVLSTMAGVASFKSISEYIPGLTRYRFTMANLHGL
ncbi:hypothetical protein ACROYT_G023351 [Oculina patagonica]